MLNGGFDDMGILCVFCVYDTIGNRCFEKTSFPKNQQKTKEHAKLSSVQSSGSELFDTLKEFFKNINFEKNQQTTIMQNYPTCKDLDGIAERIFEKINFEKNQQTTIMQNYPTCKALDLNCLIHCTLIVFLKEFFRNINFFEKNADDTHAKLPSMQKVRSQDTRGKTIDGTVH